MLGGGSVGALQPGTAVVGAPLEGALPGPPSVATSFRVDRREPPRARVDTEDAEPPFPEPDPSPWPRIAALGIVVALVILGLVLFGSGGVLR
jgi:hypothetical protein